MILSSQLFIALLAATPAFAAQAQGRPLPDQDQDKGVPPTTIQVKARTNAGDLAYDWVFEYQKLLQGYLPTRAGMVDFSWRITFTELNLTEQDAWAPRGWAVALVGKGFEQDVPVARGGYFLLPALPLGRRGSTIMFREQSMPGHIGAAWRLRIGADQRLSHAGFKQAMDEIRAVQDAIPLRYAGLEQVRTSRYDALKACFLDAGGTVLLGGRPVADARVGNCVLLKFDPAGAADGDAIEFKGALDVVTVVESADYLHYVDLPALDGVRRAAHDAGGAPEATPDTAPTKLSHLSYAWNFKRQLRLQGGVPAQERLVNFVWRIAFEGLSEPEQDAWTPRGWALALAGKGFSRAVPVARGGYFLLPTLPVGLQEASLVFRDQGRTSRIGAAFVVRLREGPRPYLYYGEIRDAMNAVRKMQDAIPDEHAELATLRAARYDGLKACFRDAGGVVFVGDMPTADATVGNCRILRFDPARRGNEKIEFVGQTDAVTVVDTARYLPSKS